MSDSAGFVLCLLNEQQKDNHVNIRQDLQEGNEKDSELLHDSAKSCDLLLSFKQYTLQSASNGSTIIVLTV